MQKTNDKGINISFEAVDLNSKPLDLFFRILLPLKPVVKVKKPPKQAHATSQVH